MKTIALIESARHMSKDEFSQLVRNQLSEIKKTKPVRTRMNHKNNFTINILSVFLFVLALAFAGIGVWGILTW